MLALIAAISASVPASVARADGDPGSDVLVFQNLFVGSDAGLSVAQQAQFGQLLTSAGRAGFPIRVAIIAGRSDLGAVTALWREPQQYARFLGLELSLAYTQRLLVVMPNGFGFNWPGHPTAPSYRLLDKIPIGTGAGGLLAAAKRAVGAMAGAGGVNLGAPATVGTRSSEPAAVPTTSVAPAAGGQGSDSVVATITAALAVIAIALLGVRFALRRRPRSRPAAAREPSQTRRTLLPVRGPGAISGLALLLAVAVGVAVITLGAFGGSGVSQGQALESNPYLDPGTSVSVAAPSFTLSDQFGQAVSLRAFRGKVVLLAFTDAECTTICPMTTTAMLDAKAMLGSAGSRVQLLGIDANPASTSLEDVWSYSELHGMLHQWHFLTGSLGQLRRVWKAYAVEAEIEHGLIAHTPALFVIGPDGKEAKVYITQQSYSAIGQLGQILAQEASSLLPTHPRVHSDISYAAIPPVGPTAAATLPSAVQGSVPIGPGRAPRLYVFFSTWDQEVTSLAGQLAALNRYASSAPAAGLPSLTGVDEGSVEPSPSALRSFLDHLPHRLSYPVAIDQTGRVADGYEVQGVPWLVLTSATGRILWYWEVSTSGWLGPSALARQVRAALSVAPRAPEGAAAVRQALSGSPAPLAALHQQAGQLLGGEPELAARIRALRGYPIVVNAWASWCVPCRSEFGLFAIAAARYGRQVAFLGADTGDSPDDARGFLAQHPVSYPSYQSSASGLGPLAVIEGLPTTIFISSAGKVVYVHTGQYDSQGTLDQDIGSYALAG